MHGHMGFGLEPREVEEAAVRQLRTSQGPGAGRRATSPAAAAARAAKDLKA